jgi:hypothetical protein
MSLLAYDHERRSSDAIDVLMLCVVMVEIDSRKRLITGLLVT